MTTIATRTAIILKGAEFVYVFLVLFFRKKGAEMVRKQLWGPGRHRRRLKEKSKKKLTMRGDSLSWNESLTRVSEGGGGQVDFN